MQYRSTFQRTWYAVCSRYSTRRHDSSTIYGPYDHISDALATLHWLRVPEREQYKIAVLTSKCFTTARRDIWDLVAVADLPRWRALSSASTSHLVVPNIKLSTVGSRAFPFAAAQVWNGLSLSESVVSSSSLQTFRRQLKTHLFQLSYLIFDRLTGIVHHIISYHQICYGANPPELSSALHTCT